MDEFSRAQREYDNMSDDPAYRDLVSENYRLREELDRLRERCGYLEKMIEVDNGEND